MLFYIAQICKGASEIIAKSAAMLNEKCEISKVIDSG